MIKPESTIDFPQLCLLHLPLLNMDSVQVPSWLCLEIDTLSVKDYSFFNKVPCQERDWPDKTRLSVFDLLQRRHINGAMECRLNQISRKRVRKSVPLHEEGLLMQYIQAVMLERKHIFMFNDKRLQYSRRKCSPLKTRSKNKLVRPGKCRRLISVELHYGSSFVPQKRSHCSDP